jgi:hypothetical protein
MTLRDSKGKRTMRDSKGRSRKTGKRPTDVNQLAHFLGEQSTRERPEPANGNAPTQAEVSRVMAALGRKGGKIGGMKRAASLSPEKRREIALKAARSRWDKKTVTSKSRPHA